MLETFLPGRVIHSTRNVGGGAVVSVTCAARELTSAKEI